MFSFQDRRQAVEVAFTDRHGVPRGGPSASLDLAEPRPGSTERESELSLLEESLDVVTHALARGGAEQAPVLVRMRQVHGADVHTVDGSWLDAGHSEPPTADGMVTRLSGVALLVRVADCVPVLLADPGRAVVGVAHAGRKGLAAGIVPATLARMRDLGARQVVGWVGPHVCGGCYEVPADLRAEVASVVPEAFAETSWGTPSLDVGAGVVAQLEAAGVEVVDASTCTVESDSLYSYRRQGAAAGRFGGVVWVRP